MRQQCSVVIEIANSAACSHGTSNRLLSVSFCSFTDNLRWCSIPLTFDTFRSARSPGGSICKRGLPVQFSVHFNHFQTTNSKG